jgi:hypothetical protein
VRGHVARVQRREAAHVDAQRAIASRLHLGLASADAQHEPSGVRGEDIVGDVQVQLGVHRLRVPTLGERGGNVDQPQHPRPRPMDCDAGFGEEEPRRLRRRSHPLEGSDERSVIRRERQDAPTRRGRERDDLRHHAVSRLTIVATIQDVALRPGIAPCDVDRHVPLPRLEHTVPPLVRTIEHAGRTRCERAVDGLDRVAIVRQLDIELPVSDVDVVGVETVVDEVTGELVAAPPVDRLCRRIQRRERDVRRAQLLQYRAHELGPRAARAFRRFDADGGDPRHPDGTSAEPLTHRP